MGAVAKQYGCLFPVLPFPVFWKFLAIFFCKEVLVF